ncbi:serine/arginine repetitive matrix protein 4-like isoform X2 [Acipenser ruthenus]|uniref:serine/arginine repetitive matrix protein 4-like isoform X2 n=1 Tax=Acipenser ruthenus TaxID=7906 RepID=UPI00145BB8A2|nr:serine/arginine repetitive matrix protein 4-like isoform X2 [Acipenser ruthenus]
MASMQQGEKQLFEKFWRGTFKAVATPRPGSILVASIIARRTVANSDTSNCQASEADEGKPAVMTEQTSDRNGCIKARESKHRSHHRSPSLSFDEDLSPPPAPKGKKKKKKKKKKKSDRKRRRRSPSYSPSPVRKKKKKSSRKRKRNRSASEKRRHSSSTPKSKRKVERKHRKRSRSHSRRRHRCRHSESGSSTRHSSSSNSRHRRRSPEAGSLRSPARRHTSSGNLPNSVEQGGSTWVRSDMPGCKAPLNHCSISSDTIIKHSGSAAGLFTEKESNHDIVSNQHKGHQDYDSGNDTSSPPSTKTGLPRSKDDEEKKIVYQVELPSPEKLRFNGDDSGSDSGNSVSSYSSLCQPLLSASPVTSKIEREVSSPCLGAVGEKRRTSSPKGGSLYLRGRSRTHSHSSSRSCSSRSSSYFSRSPEHKLSPDYSRRRSLSSEESYSAKSRKRSLESWSSQSCRSPSYSRYNPDRSRETDNKKYGSKEKESKRERERRRCQSYSPMRKRRRDSPSHLEARRITSARKRPIPYYRPSPSSSSRSSSCCSWYSSRSRSATRCHSGTRSRSRSQSHSTYRNHSRSPSWSSGSRRSRSPSWSSGSRRSRSSLSESYNSLCSSSRGRR